ncbi:MAG: hypothetical protein E6R07_10340 [Nevskiaceae bacterium]|nr:MAG: hypothetical protein E6R07_10340 [Nevskiaceae bacterium]
MLTPASQRLRRPPLLPFLMFAGGLGACLYFGQQWYQLPTYSENDIKASVELNLKLDLERRPAGQAAPDEVELARMRASLQQEIAGQVANERREVVQRFGLGLVAAILGTGQLLMAWWTRRRRV